MDSLSRANRRFARLAITWCVSFGVVAAFANDFSWQVSGSYRDGDATATAEFRDSSLRATRYLSAVDDQMGPYELAPFLNRSGYVTVSLGRTKLRERFFPEFASLSGPPIVVNGTLSDNVNDVLGPAIIPALGIHSSASGIEFSEYVVQGRYVWPQSGWYTGAVVQRSDGDPLPEPAYLQTTMERESTGLLAGRYLGPRTTVELGIGSEAAVQNTQPSLSGVVAAPVFDIVGFADFRTRADIDTEHARLSIRHVGTIGGSTFAVTASVRTSRLESRMVLSVPPEIYSLTDPFSAEPGGRFDDTGPGLERFGFSSAGFSRSESERQFDLSGALFPSEDLGIRLTYSGTAYDSFRFSEWVGLSVRWFFVPSTAAEIKLVRADSERDYSFDSREIDSIEVRLIGRF